MKKLVLALLFVALPAVAQQYEYAAKYVCGRSGGGAPNNFAAGLFYTSINVHSDVRTPFTKVITVSWPGEKFGGRTKPIPSGVDADTSLQVDCINIYGHLKVNGITVPPGQPTEGFVIIRSNVALDVVGVYTAAGAGNLVSTMHMERVPPRMIRQ